MNFIKVGKNQHKWNEIFFQKHHLSITSRFSSADFDLLGKKKEIIEIYRKRLRINASLF